jgi:hypothetical protein
MHPMEIELDTPIDGVLTAEIIIESLEEKMKEGGDT